MRGTQGKEKGGKDDDGWDVHYDSARRYRYEC